MTAARTARLDQELVRRGLAPSRTRAAELIADGRVRADGAVFRRAAARVAADCALRVAPAATGRPDFVSRGGNKLAAALREFAHDEPPLVVAGRRCLDAGASTGGFTQALLLAGAERVVAVDVGHDQLAAPLRTDPRVVSREGTNVRDLGPTDIGGPVDVTVADLSFISLPLVLSALRACTRPEGDLVLLVKPQFEVGRGLLARGGVVADPRLHAQALHAVLDTAAAVGLAARGLIRSPLAGRAGNTEFLLRLGATGTTADRRALVASVVDE